MVPKRSIIHFYSFLFIRKCINTSADKWEGRSSIIFHSDWEKERRNRSKKENRRWVTSYFSCINTQKIISIFGFISSTATRNDCIYLRRHKKGWKYRVGRFVCLVCNIVVDMFPSLPYQGSMQMIKCLTN